MSIRCPRCRKKHLDARVTRCGCGESLLAVTASERAQIARPARSGSSQTSDTLPAGLPAHAAQHGVSTDTAVLTDNEW